MSGRGDLKRHPLSAACGDMPDPEFYALVEDVRARGVQDAITIHEDMILDGWHRYRAALKAGVPWTEDLYEGDDPQSFVLQRNILRKHLNATQRAVVVCRILGWRAPGRYANPATVSGLSEKQLAEIAACGPKTIREVKRGIREGHGSDLFQKRKTIKDLRRMRELDRKTEAGHYDRDYHVEAEQRKAKASGNGSQPREDKPPRTGTLRYKLDQAEVYIDTLKERVARLEQEKAEGWRANAPEIIAENERLKEENRRLSHRVFEMERQLKGGATWGSRARSRAKEGTIGEIPEDGSITKDLDSPGEVVTRERARVSKSGQVILDINDIRRRSNYEDGA